MHRMQELASLIISIDEVVDKLNTFFTDSIILRLDHTIQAVGSEVEQLTGFTSGELSGRYFHSICADAAFRESLDQELKSGYFTDSVTTLLTKDNVMLSVSISGFYLGIISDINGYIILKVKAFENTATLKQELVSKRMELDTFIYRAAHDLRGPLATIKGLVNLIKIRQGNTEIDELNELIEVHANKLDDRLFKLLYLSDNTSKEEVNRGITHFDSVRCSLERTLRDNFEIDRATIEFKFPQQAYCELPEARLLQLLNNVLLYIISLPVTTLSKEDSINIVFCFENRLGELRINIHAKGFVVEENIRKAVSQPVSLYNDILSYPSLFNYYVAQREARQINGSLQVVLIEENEQVLQLSLPVNTPPMPEMRIADKSKNEKRTSNHTVL